MAARLVVLCVGVVVFMSFPAWASDAVDAESPSYRESVVAENHFADAVDGDDGAFSILEPRIDAGMSDDNRKRLASSFQIAIDRVREVPECRELFSKLGADGLDTIAKTYFAPIGIHGARANVCNGSVAYTFVGGKGPTWLCREFSRLSDKKAAMIIIHEALHHAGLTERPKDPKAMTSAGINRMVSKSCGL